METRLELFTCLRDISASLNCRYVWFYIHTYIHTNIFSLPLELIFIFPKITEYKINYYFICFQNPVAISFEIFWMIFEPILFGVTGTQIKIDELEGETVYLSIGCLLVGIILRMIGTILVGVGSKLNLKEKIFIALACMAKATVQAALGPVTLDEIDKNDPDQLRYAETTLNLCVLSILLTAPTGAIIMSISGPKLLTKTAELVAPPEGWRTRRPSIRDISIITEDPDLEDTASDEYKP